MSRQTYTQILFFVYMFVYMFNSLALCFDVAILDDISRFDDHHGSITRVRDNMSGGFQKMFSFQVIMSSDVRQTIHQHKRNEQPCYDI